MQELKAGCADDAEGLVPAAVAGHCVMVASEWLVGPHLAAGRLERVLDKWIVEGERAIHLVRHSARFTAAKSRAFADWIATRMSPPPWTVP